MRHVRHTRAWRTAALMALVVGAALWSPPGHAQHVGEIRFSLSPTDITFPPTAKNTQIFETFRVTNNTECGITLRHRSAGGRSFSSFCTGFTNLGEILPGQFVGCRAYFRPVKKRALKGRIHLTLGYGFSCKGLVRNQVIGRHKPKIDRVIAERDKHTRAGPDYKALDAALVRARDKHRETIKTLKDRERTLRYQQPEVDRLTQRRKVWRQRVRGRDSRLTARLNELRTKGVDLSVMRNVLAEVTTRGNAAIAKVQADISTKCGLVDRLRAERDQAISEVRNGIFCAACKRPPSRIRREQNESFQQHIRRVGRGTMRPTQRMIQKEQDIWRRKIAAATRTCSNVRPRAEKERKRWKARYDQVAARQDRLKDRHAKRVKTLAQHLRDLRAQTLQRDKEMTAAIDAADYARRKKWTDAQDAIRKREASWRQAQQDYKVKRTDIAKAHRQRADKLERSVRALEKERDKAITKALVRLKRTRSAVVRVNGVGQ